MENKGAVAELIQNTILLLKEKLNNTDTMMAFSPSLEVARSEFLARTSHILANTASHFTELLHQRLDLTNNEAQDIVKLRDQLELHINKLKEFPAQGNQGSSEEEKYQSIKRIEDLNELTKAAMNKVKQFTQHASSGLSIEVEVDEEELMSLILRCVRVTAKRGTQEIFIKDRLITAQTKDEISLLQALERERKRTQQIISANQVANYWRGIGSYYQLGGIGYAGYFGYPVPPIRGGKEGTVQPAKTVVRQPPKPAKPAAVEALVDFDFVYQSHRHDIDRIISILQGNKDGLCAISTKVVGDLLLNIFLDCEKDYAHRVSQIFVRMPPPQLLKIVNEEYQLKVTYKKILKSLEEEKVQEGVDKGRQV